VNGIREERRPLKIKEQMGVGAGVGLFTHQRSEGGQNWERLNGKAEASRRQGQGQRQIKPRSQIGHPAHPTSVVCGSATRRLGSWQRRIIRGLPAEKAEDFSPNSEEGALCCTASNRSWLTQGPAKPGKRFAWVPTLTSNE